MSTDNTLPAIALVGTGYWGKNLVRNFHDLGALTLICDKDEMSLARFKEQYPDVETCLALNDVLLRDDIKGLVIATPAETHYTVAREALLAGKHVFIEKPMALRQAEGQELIELARQQQRVLMIGHLLQYHPVFVRLKELVAGGELGRINYIYSNRLNLGKIRREENILWSFAPHDLSMILTLAGEEPESVIATGGNYLHHSIADVTTTHLEFSSGLRAHIFVSWLHPFKEQKLVVVGERKMAVFDDMQPWGSKLLLYPHEIKWKNNMPVPAKAEPEHVDVPQDEPLKLECRHFLECIRNGKQPVTDGEEGLRVLKVLNAGQQSLESQGASVTLASMSQQAPPSKADTRASAPPSQTKYFAHETAILDEQISIGEGTKIWHFVHVLSGSVIGKNCTVGQNVMIGPDVKIGDGCKIQNNVAVYRGVTLEEGVFCGPSMVFTNVHTPRSEVHKMDQLRSTYVKRGATIGANATIVCGVTLGRYAFIGAGAVVLKDVPDHALVVGNPARQVGWMCECGERLDEELVCTVCQQAYRQVDSGLEPYREE